MIHGGGYRTSVFVVRESHTEVSVHGGGVEGIWVAVAERLESFVILGTPGKNCSTVINMGVEDEGVGVFGTSDLEFSEVAFKLNVAQGEKELCMIFIEDLVGDTSTVDATKDFDKGVAVGLRKIRRESTVTGSGK